MECSKLLQEWLTNSSLAHTATRQMEPYLEQMEACEQIIRCFGAPRRRLSSSLRQTALGCRKSYEKRPML